MLKYSVGLDISSKDIHACLSVISQSQQVTVKASRKLPNTLQGWKELQGWITRHHQEQEVPLVICMEATGVYYEQCALYLFKEGFRVSVLLPNLAKKYLQASGQKSKNDKIDARGLARMGAEKSLEPWQPMGEFFYRLRILTRHRQGLQELKTSIANQLHANLQGIYLDNEVLEGQQALLKLITQQLEACDKQIQSTIDSQPEVAAKVALICRIKGVGMQTVATVLAETNGFVLFRNARGLVSYAGYDVIENQSGKHKGKTRISKKGNSRLRRILFMPAFVVVTHQVKPFADLYERTLAKHGLKMKSYVAVQKKLLVIIYALWKGNEAFDENYAGKQPGEQESVLPLGSAA